MATRGSLGVAGGILIPRRISREGFMEDGQEKGGKVDHVKKKCGRRRDAARRWDKGRGEHDSLSAGRNRKKKEIQKQSP